MCTISGVVLSNDITNEESIILRDACIQMMINGEDRGKDGTGMVFVINKKIEKIYSKDPASIFCRNERNVIDYYFSKMCRRGDLVVINNRFQPLPQPDSPIETQPICLNSCIISHNGTFSNDHMIYDDLRKEENNITSITGIDTEAFLYLYRHYRRSKLSPLQSLLETNLKFAGGRAISIFDLDEDTLFLFRDFKPLVIAFDHRLKTFIWSSEEKNIVKSFRPNEEVKFLSNSELELWRIPPFTGMEIKSSRIKSTFSIQTKILSTLPQQQENAAAVICSGGMDSSLSAAIAVKCLDLKVTLIHFDYGQKASKKESGAVKAVAKALKCKMEEIDLAGLGKYHKQSPLIEGDVPLGTWSAESTMCWVSARNMIMLAMGAAFCEANGLKYLFTGFNLEEGGVYPDNVREFFDYLNATFEFGTLTRVKTKQSIAKLMKPEIVRLGTYLGVPLDKTWSCDTGGLGKDKLPCGVCGCCWTRRWAYVKSGLEDPQQYYHNQMPEPPVWWIDKNYRISTTPIEELINRCLTEVKRDI